MLSSIGLMAAHASRTGVHEMAVSVPVPILLPQKKYKTM